MAGLNVSNVVSVSINLSPIAAPLRNFGALCIAGTSGFIDPIERVREYTTLDGVAADFGSGAPEYLAADLFFSRAGAVQPQPNRLRMGLRRGRTGAARAGDPGRGDRRTLPGRASASGQSLVMPSPMLARTTSPPPRMRRHWTPGVR